MTARGSRTAHKHARARNARDLSSALTRSAGLLRSLIAVGLAVMVAACSLAANSGVPATPPAVATVPPSTELVVGAVFSSTGRLSREGAALRAGYRLWAARVNEDGGVRVGAQRRRVRLVELDDGSDPLGAARAVERFAREHGPGVVLGPATNALTTAASTVAQRHGVLLVAPDGPDAVLPARGVTTTVSMLPPESAFLHAVVAHARAQSPQVRPIGVLAPDEPFFVAAVDGLVAATQEAGLGRAIVGRFGLDERELVLPLDRVARQRPKLIILGAEPEQLGRLLEAARELALGKAGLVIAVKPIGPYAEELPAGVPDSATIVRTWYPRLDASGPLLGSAREYAATYERTFGHQPDARAAAASAAGLIVQLAVERAGSTDVARVRAALDARGFDTFFGRLSWDAAGQRLGAPPLATIERRSLVPFEPNRLVGFAP